MRELPEIKLESIDSLLGCEGVDDTVNISITELHPFKNHPYQVRNDDSMQKLIKSIELQGVLVPITVRCCSEGGYEIISGHRRCFAAKEAGLTSVPGIIKECSDDDAVIMMVDSNIQREGTLISEKAFAYKLKYESMKHQGRRGGNSLAEMGKATGENAKTIERIISLTRLTPSLLKGVDEKRIGLSAGYSLSSMSDEDIKKVSEMYERYNSRISNGQAKRIVGMSLDGMLSREGVFETLRSTEVPFGRITLNRNRISKYFPEGMSKEDIENEIYHIIDILWQEREQSTVLN